MYNQHVERSAGFAGIAFVIVLALAAALPGIPPLAAAAPREIGDYIATHRIMWLISAWLALPLSAFFLWFVVQLRAFLRLMISSIKRRYAPSSAKSALPRSSSASRIALLR